MYQCKWERSDEFNYIDDLAKEYHQRCDAYDERVCMGVNEYGEKIPVTTYQYNAVNANARAVLNDLKSRIPHTMHGELQRAIARN